MSTLSAALRATSPADDDPQAVFLKILPRIVQHARISFRMLRCSQRRAEAVQEVVALTWKWFRALLARGKDAARVRRGPGPLRRPRRAPRTAPVRPGAGRGCVLRHRPAPAWERCSPRQGRRSVRRGPGPLRRPRRALGRRLCGQEPAADVFSVTAQRRHGFSLERLPSAAACRWSNSTAWSAASSSAMPWKSGSRTTRGPRCPTRPPSGWIFHRFWRRSASAIGVWPLTWRGTRRGGAHTRTPVPDQAAFRLDFPPFLASLSERDRRLAAYLALGHSAVAAARRFGLSPGRVTQLRQRWCRQWRIRQGEETPAARPLAATG